jgi:hypothetical protein
MKARWRQTSENLQTISKDFPAESGEAFGNEFQRLMY